MSTSASDQADIKLEDEGDFMVVSLQPSVFEMEKKISHLMKEIKDLKESNQYLKLLLEEQESLIKLGQFNVQRLLKGRKTRTVDRDGVDDNYKRRQAAPAPY